MTTSWEALGARARGLATHLLSEERARVVEHAVTAADVWHALRDTPYARHLGLREGGPDALELGVARSLAERMAVLALWAGPAGGALRSVFVGQDARNVRDILRGLLGAVPPERRTASAVPTPLLGRKELETLARAASPAELAATLVAWEHPLGSALLEEARRRHPDPYRLEASLAQVAAAESTRSARRGGALLRAFVREEIDVDNASTALLLAAERTESEAAELFVEGGEALTREDFAKAAAEPTRAAVAERLAAATRVSTVSAALAELPSTSAALAERVLSARIGDLAGRSRQEPASTATVLLFVLRLRREAELVRRALWRAALTGRRPP